ncbi:hypothetical protein [Streptomyces sp. NPDC059863]|uniref:hypothetical protein n=1 Tax=Streptomyces sp. NPDC059863 TaxID=3346976 RepID=UPI00364ABDF4
MGEDLRALVGEGGRDAGPVESGADDVDIGDLPGVKPPGERRAVAGGAREAP